MKLRLVLLCIVLAISFVSCANTPTPSETTAETTPEVTSEATHEATPEATPEPTPEATTSEATTPESSASSETAPTPETSDESTPTLFETSPGNPDVTPFIVRSLGAVHLRWGETKAGTFASQIRKYDPEKEEFVFYTVNYVEVSVEYVFIYESTFTDSEIRRDDPNYLPSSLFIPESLSGSITAGNEALVFLSPLYEDTSRPSYSGYIGAAANVTSYSPFEIEAPIFAIENGSEIAEDINLGEISFKKGTALKDIASYFNTESAK